MNTVELKQAFRELAQDSKLPAVLAAGALMVTGAVELGAKLGDKYFDHPSTTPQTQTYHAPDSTHTQQR